MMSFPDEKAYNAMVERIHARQHRLRWRDQSSITNHNKVGNSERSDDDFLGLGAWTESENCRSNISDSVRRRERAFEFDSAVGTINGRGYVVAVVKPSRFKCIPSAFTFLRNLC